MFSCSPRSAAGKTDVMKPALEKDSRPAPIAATRFDGCAAAPSAGRRELRYRDENLFMLVPVEGRRRFQAETPRVLFDGA